MNDEYITTKETKFARWAWRLSLIPLLGLIPCIILSFIALYKIGKYGYIGFYFLKRASIVSLFYISMYFGVYLSGYSAYQQDIYDVLYSNFPKHGITFTYYPFFQTVKEEITWRFGVKHGIYCLWSSDGFILLRGQYIDDKRNGVWFSFHRDNSFEEIQYENDKENGKEIRWWSKNRKCWEGNNINGRRSGKWQNYDKDGKKSHEEIYP